MSKSTSALAQSFSAGHIQLELVQEADKLDFTHFAGAPGNSMLVEFMAAGLALFDYDRDGRIDVFFCNGTDLLGKDNTRRSNGLFQNQGQFQFANRSQAVTAVKMQYALGVTAGDYNNDGFQDLFVSNFGSNELLRNNGDGTFTEVTVSAGLLTDSAFGAGSVWLDADTDGDLDLFAGKYVDFSLRKHQELAPKSFPFPPGPKDFDFLADEFFINQGDGTFENVSQTSGIASVRGPSMGAIGGDFDADGDTDIFVCCDGAPNHLFVNDGTGLFVEQGVLTGVAYDLRGVANGSMGVDAGDVDRDGFIDLFVSDYSEQLPMLFTNLSGIGFEDVTRVTGIGRAVKPHVNWGVALFDVDQDADLDALIANGHFLPHAKQVSPETDFAVLNTLMEQRSGLVFEPVEQHLPNTASAASSRGLAVDDLDGDGDLDAIVLNCGTSASLLENRSRGGNFLKVELLGRSSNRDAVGARVEVLLGSQRLIREVHGGRGYQSYFGGTLHFGVGSAKTVEQVEIHWPSGHSQVLQMPATNQTLTIVEPR